LLALQPLGAEPACCALCANATLHTGCPLGACNALRAKTACSANATLRTIDAVSAIGTLCACIAGIAPCAGSPNGSCAAL